MHDINREKLVQKYFVTISVPQHACDFTRKITIPVGTPPLPSVCSLSLHSVIFSFICCHYSSLTMQLMICKCNVLQESVLVSSHDHFLSKGATTYTVHVSFIIHMSLYVSHEPWTILCNVLYKMHMSTVQGLWIDNTLVIR